MLITKLVKISNLLLLKSLSNNYCEPHKCLQIHPGVLRRRALKHTKKRQTNNTLEKKIENNAGKNTLHRRKSNINT